MLLAGDLGKLTEGQQEYLRQILQLDEYMIELITSQADIERLQRGQIILHVEPCNINSVIKLKARQDIMVLADPARLKQMFIGMQKAIKGELRARISEDRCVVTLDSPKVLSRTHRGALVQDLSFQITKLLAEAHGGELTLDPHSSTGTKLRLYLPLAQQLSLLGETGA